jgi:hypothetical protein
MQGHETGLLELGLLDHASKLDFSSSNAFERFPSGCIQEIIVLGMQSASKRISLGHDGKGLEGFGTILPVNQDVAGGPFAAGIG